jgi:hypothetical protein
MSATPPGSVILPTASSLRPPAIADGRSGTQRCVQLCSEAAVPSNEQKGNIELMLCWPALRQRGSLASGTWGVETTPGKTLTNELGVALTNEVGAVSRRDRYGQDFRFTRVRGCAACGCVL